MSRIKLVQFIEIVLISVVTVLCFVLILNLLKKLRTILPWRVNCWFCNQNAWIKLPQINCWNCPKCEQYNGFTKDGDYNKPLFSPNDKGFKKPKSFGLSSPKNGLCKMCNINQQLKVTQLANFVPMNDKSFDDEIESYRSQLEKAYKLCSPCRKVVQMKLHKEKETLLGSKLIEARTPEKKKSKMDMQNKRLKNLLNKLLTVTLTILLLFSLIDTCYVLMNDENLSNTILNLRDIILMFLERLFTILRNKLHTYFPTFDNLIFGHSEDLIDYDTFSIYLNKVPLHVQIDPLEIINLGQSILGGFACFIQLLGHVYSLYEFKYTVIFDLLLTVVTMTEVLQPYIGYSSLTTCLIKVPSIFLLHVLIQSIKKKSALSSKKTNIISKKLKNLANNSITQTFEEDSSSNSMDTDDDISLTKFGVHNFTDSSNENTNVMNSTFMSGRTFSPRQHNTSLWTTPNAQSRMNSTFCANSIISKSPSSVTDTLYRNSSAKQYQKLAREDSDSDENLSISSLCIGSPKKAKSTTNSMFSLRKFVAAPSFVAPSVMPINRGRPLISPSKLSHGTSWVAGGYWGSEAGNLFNMEDSRSSSQSSGFESQASSLNQRNVFSQPPSREESVFGEPEKNFLDKFQNCNMSSYNYPQPQSLSRMGSPPPVYPQMQYNSHVHIPQPRMAQRPTTRNTFYNQPFVQDNLSRSPSMSSLFNVNAFSSH